MSTEAFEDFYFRVCTLDYGRMAPGMRALAGLMERTDRVHIKGPGTDLRFSIKGIGAEACGGRAQHPGRRGVLVPGARFSVEGVLQYNAPTVYLGTSFDNIRLVFRKGRIVEATGSNTKRLNEILDSDAGARYVGEFALGFNPHILEPMRDILFDEKIAGSFHFTPGQAYAKCGNGNRSQVHWDLVCIQRPEYGGGEIWFDGQPDPEGRAFRSEGAAEAESGLLAAHPVGLVRRGHSCEVAVNGSSAPVSGLRCSAARAPGLKQDRRRLIRNATSSGIARDCRPGPAVIHGPPRPTRRRSRMDSIHYTVPPSTRRGRADKVLAEAFPAYSRAALQRAFDAGLVRRNGAVIGRDDTLAPGDTVEFSFPDVKPAELRAVAIPLDVLYEDSHMLAVNKPAGMVVHPGVGTGEDTLVHALLAHCADGLSGIGGIERPGIVHRLDKETSGVLVVAKDDAAHRGLSEQFAGRQLRKEYLALVAGVPRLKAGVIDRSISRHPVHRERMATGEGGRAARTDWEVIEAFGDVAALLRCRIHTGRTHQIRVHLKSIAHPVLGDSTYGWKRDPRLPEVPRVMLHAEHLACLHPITARPLDLRAPLPADFEKLLRALRAL